jgi:hypothetical protein
MAGHSLDETEGVNSVPRLVPDLEIVPWRRSHVVGVQVHASPIRPQYLQREGRRR